MALKYNNILMICGGGTRFAIYCGIFQALEENGIRPDLIIASCGGSLAAQIITKFDSTKERKSYICSTEFYNFIKSLKVSTASGFGKLPLFCLKKMTDRRNAPYIEDVFNRYLVDMPVDLSECLPTLNSQTNEYVPVITVASRILYDKKITGELRNDNKLFRKLLITDDQTAQNIPNLPDSVLYKDSAIESGFEILTDISGLNAVRMSISDMFYVQPAVYNDLYFMGGIPDLVPIELAQAMGNKIITEIKSGYSFPELSLIRSVFGFDARKRLKETNSANCFMKIDTRMMDDDLEGAYISKKIDWRNLRININNDISFTEFFRQINLQWEYGYKITKQILSK